MANGKSATSAAHWGMHSRGGKRVSLPSKYPLFCQLSSHGRKWTNRVLVASGSLPPTSLLGKGPPNEPFFWGLRWPQCIANLLGTDKNPGGTITNSDLELAGGLLHLEGRAQTFDIRERTVLSKPDSLNTLFW